MKVCKSVCVFVQCLSHPVCGCQREKEGERLCVYVCVCVCVCVRSSPASCRDNHQLDSTHPTCSYTHTHNQDGAEPDRKFVCVCVCMCVCEKEIINEL